jgi:thioredoxin-like negative regulator of GroEL
VRTAAPGREAEETISLPALVFVSRRQDGASRRTESLVAWVKVTQKKRLQVIEVDADRQPSLARSLSVRRIPSLVVVKDRRVVGRLEGRATGRQIDDLIRPHLG